MTTNSIVNIKNTDININVIGFEKIREDRTCSRKLFEYREYDIEFQIGDTKLCESLFFDIRGGDWEFPWFEESYLQYSYYDALIEVLTSIVGEMSEKTIKLAISDITDVLIDWARDNIRTIYINTQNFVNSTCFNDSEAEIFYSHAEREAHKLGYEFERIYSSSTGDPEGVENAYYGRYISADFISDLLRDFELPEQDDETINQ